LVILNYFVDSTVKTVTFLLNKTVICLPQIEMITVGNMSVLTTFQMIFKNREIKK